METGQSFGERLKSLRVEMGYNQEAFAELVGITKQMIYIYEKGHSEPTLSKLLAIANRCEVSLDWLCGLSESVDITTNTEQLINFYRYLDCTEDSHQMMRNYIKNHV